ncbi:MAG: hypothetical protein R3315_11185 [Woeseiaceae bacterium]|nr:hypothetical protein [Woeseiaceae bacterium]
MHPRHPLLAVLSCLALAVPAAQSQEESDAGQDDDADEVEEIVVVAPRPGFRRRIDPELEDPLRARILRELYEMREDEAEVAILDAAARSRESRIEFGYDPSEDYLRRREFDLAEPQRESVRPATILRIRF